MGIELQHGIYTTSQSPKWHFNTPTAAPSVVYSQSDNIYPIRDTLAAVNPFEVCVF